MAELTFSVIAAEMRREHGDVHTVTGIHHIYTFRLTFSRRLQIDQRPFILEAERRRDLANDSAQHCMAQRAAQERDAVRRRIDAVKQHYWELMAASYNKLTQGNDRKWEEHIPSLLRD